MLKTIKTFKQHYYDTFITESSLTNYKYKVPKDVETILFDFYLLISLPIKALNYNVRNQFLLTDIVEDGRNTIVNYLKNDQLKDVLFSILAEFRHVMVNNNIKDIFDLAKKYGIEKEIRNYLLKYKLRNTDSKELIPRFKRIRTEFDEKDKRGYVDSYKALISSIGGKKELFVEFAKDAFTGLHWSSSYGGQPWANIADAWLKLYNAHDYGDKTVYIDHIFDLQHNTDTVFNKIEKYAKAGGYTWLADALDKKRDAGSLFDLVDDASLGLKLVAAQVIKGVMGQTYEDWAKNKEPEPNIPKLSDGEKNNSSKKITSKKTNSNIGTLSGGLTNHPGDTWTGGTWENGYWEGGIWKGGTWEGGYWDNGYWEGGIWKGGNWEYGTWEDGTWEDGAWDNGYWKGGTWKGGTWENGTWEGGYWENGTWEGGLWKNGTWENGLWTDGTWKNGLWTDGTWKGGLWKGGYWEGGNWEGGTWENGMIYDPQKNTYIGSTLNPKEYFKKK